MKSSGIYKILFTCIVFVLFAFSMNICFASDYKYKVLDPKYNPEAEQLISGKLPSIRTMPPDKNKGFDVGTFLAIFAIVTFPIGIIYVAVKTFNEVMQPYEENKSEETTNSKLVMGNIKINANEIKDDSEQVLEKTEAKTFAVADSEKISSTFVKKYFSSNVEQIPNPMLLYTSQLSANKGFCLVEYNKKYSLIGYINDEIFLLNQFDTVKTNEIRSRISETTQTAERYIVRLDNYKALVEVTDQKMELLIDL